MSAPKPAFVEPMKALGVARIPAGDWLLENKFDGYRALAVRRGRQTTLYSRRGNDLTTAYPEIADAVADLPAGDLVLDGEIVALDAEGRPRFQRLQQRDLGEARPPLFYYVFDLLHHGDRSFIGQPIEVRRLELSRLSPHLPLALRVSPTFDVSPEKLLARMKAEGLEGIVAKAAGSAYEPGRRSGAWLKCRVAQEQEFVIGGFSAPRASREFFGALLIGYYRDERLVYAGKVGTGFDGRTLADLHAQMSRLRTPRAPFGEVPAEAARLGRVTWVRPRLVAQIRFSEWTDDGRLRQPVYLGLRDDKAAREVVREATAA